MSFIHYWLLEIHLFTGTYHWEKTRWQSHWMSWRGADNLFKDGSVSPRHVMLNISIQSVKLSWPFFGFYNNIAYDVINTLNLLFPIILLDCIRMAVKKTSQKMSWWFLSMETETKSQWFPLFLKEARFYANVKILLKLVLSWWDWFML